MNNRYFSEKYISGSIKSLNKLINLFFYAKMNIRDFMTNLESYQNYFAKKMNNNQIKLKSDIENLEANNLIKINRLLYNAIISLDSLFYILYDEKANKWINEDDIIEIIDEFKSLSKVKHLDKYLDLKFIIHRARCKILHTGEFVCSFVFSPLKENNNKYIATFILDFPKFLSKKYLKENKMDKYYYFDAHEVFENVLIKFETIESKLKNLLNSKNIK